MKRLLNFLAGERRRELGGGRTLRLLSAMEVLEARREAAELVDGGREMALCDNACLLSRALERRGRAVYPTGRAVLESLRLEEIEALSRCWARFNEEANPSVRMGERELEGLKKAWSTRRRSALNGVCSRIFGRFPRRNGPGR